MFNITVCCSYERWSLLGAKAQLQLRYGYITINDLDDEFEPKGRAEATSTLNREIETNPGSTRYLRGALIISCVKSITPSHNT